MTQHEFKRRLSAILSADVRGYSRMMREDEDATIRTLTTYRKAMSEMIQQFRGRVVDATGDNLLAEFTSVVDAVNCAVEIQRDFAERNADLPPERKMEFRIGVNLGDVVEKEGRIYGDGVNIASRIEGRAEGGGICISGSVYDSIENRLGLEYEYLGEQAVKNIEKPVRMYRVLSFPGAAAHRVIQAKEAFRRKWRKAALAISAALIAGTIVVVGWNFYQLLSIKREPSSLKKMAYTLPDKPSIAVLPFDNMSGDAEQDYLADGISENIITALSYIPQMFVIARNSTFTYKGKPVKVQRVSEELGVRYVLEGSVQRSGDQVRVTAQLIDATTGGHIWSKRFDRDLKDLFNLLDEITQEIVVALQVKLTHGEQARIWQGSTRKLEAWGYAVKGLDIFYHYTPAAMAQARRFFEQALEIDPDYAHAVIMLAWTDLIDARFGFSDSREVSFKRAVELATKALAMDDGDPLVHSLWQYIYLIQRQHDKAIEEGRKAIALGPNLAEVHILFGEALYYAGLFEEAVEMCEKAIRLHPHSPIYYLGEMMVAYRWAGRYDESLALAEQLFNRSRKVEYIAGVEWAHLNSAIAYMELGRQSEAREEVAKLLKVSPNYNLDILRYFSFYKDPAHSQRVFDALRKAGLPEHSPQAESKKP